MWKHTYRTVEYKQKFGGNKRRSQVKRKEKKGSDGGIRDSTHNIKRKRITVRSVS